MSLTRRTLQAQKVAELRDRARELHLPTAGRKSALIDRICRASRGAPAQQGTPAPPPPPVPLPGTPAAPQGTLAVPPAPRSVPETAVLASTVQQLIDSSLQGVEERLLQAIRPLSRPPPTADNLSLPSRDEPQPLLAAAGAGAPFAADGQPDALDEETGPAPPGIATLKGVVLPPVPAKTTQRIIRGEFVEFDSLLHEALYPRRYGIPPTPSFSFRLANDPSSEGEMIVTQQKAVNKRNIRDLGSWMEAWNIYVAVLVAHYPALASELLACHGNFGPAKILVPGPKFSVKLVRTDYVFLKKLVPIQKSWSARNIARGVGIN